jgi:hypothetical protein
VAAAGRPCGLEYAFASFVVADADGFLNRGNEDFPVPDLPRLRGFQNHIDGSVHERIGEEQFERRMASSSLYEVQIGAGEIFECTG